MAARTQGKILLGLGLQTGRLGYVVMHSGGMLLDYGITDFNLRSTHRASDTLARLQSRFKPSVALLQDTSEEACCLGATAKSIAARLQVQLAGARAACRLVSKKDLSAPFAGKDLRNKQEFAERLAALYPELESYLPPKQRIWDNQPRSMCLFTALGLVHSELDCEQEKEL